LVKLSLYGSKSEWFRQAAFEKMQRELNFKDQLTKEIKDNSKIIKFIEEPSFNSVVHNNITYKILSEAEKNLKINGDA
jgi:hypothetical protein